MLLGVFAVGADRGQRVDRRRTTPELLNGGSRRGLKPGRSAAEDKSWASRRPSGDAASSMRLRGRPRFAPVGRATIGAAMQHSGLGRL